MYLTIILLPLLNGFLSTNRLCGYKYGSLVSILNSFILCIIATLIFIEVGLNESEIYIKMGNLIQSLYLNVEWSFLFDTLNVSMFLPILYVSLIVQMYSYDYMYLEAHKLRFYSYLSFFTFFMLVLITGENLMILFIGWEGVGLISYLLIHFWHTRLLANYSAFKAFLINRIGDTGLSLALLMLLTFYTDLSFSTILGFSSFINADLLFLIFLFIIIGAITKSGQIGLNTWLTAAMEAPTPVSALLHSATMVTAGIFLMMRFSLLLEYISIGALIMTFLGGFSALLGAAGGLLENDIKRVIAYSTISQLGYMLVACGVSQYQLALFHLINHANFKALLFLSAGSVIHSIFDNQDLRRMGSLNLLLPHTYTLFLLGSLSLMAFPFLTGFYSKDFLLVLLSFPNYNLTNTIAYIFTLLAAYLTSIYSIRLLIMIFISKPNLPHIFMKLSSTSLSFFHFISLYLLAFGSAFFGYLTHELFLGLGHTFYSNSLFTHPNHMTILNGLLSPWTLFGTFLLPLATLFFILCLFPFPSSSSSKRHSTKRYKMIYRFSNLLFSFNFIYHWIILSFLHLSTIITRSFDKGLLEFLGSTGFIRFFNYLAFKLELLAIGYFLNYAFLILLFFIFISLFLLP